MTNYCNKCEQPMARDEEASLVDGDILCLNCLPENQMTFQQFQATRKKVTAPYMFGNDPELFNTYLGTFTGEGTEYVEDTSHICISDDDQYYLFLGNTEHYSNNLEELEKLLFEWIQEN